MKKAIADKWVNALGEYKQTKHTMRKGNAFCPLGVLCDIYGKEKGIEWVKEKTLGGKSTYLFLDSEATLPYEVVEWAGMRTPCGDFQIPTEQQSPSVKLAKQIEYHDVNIAGLNDGGENWCKDGGCLMLEPHSFDEIAKLIKENYKKL